MNIRLRVVIIVFTILLTGAGSLFSGEVAQWINLGFSGDGRYFAFSQYGVADSDTVPFADMYIVNVSGNKFVSDGIFHFNGAQSIGVGEDGSAALYTAFSDNVNTIRRYNIVHTNQGRLIYASINGQNPKTNIGFSDFETDDRYSIRLNQKQRGDAAAFDIHLEIGFANGRSRSFTVGLPNFYRDNVKSYRIGRIIVSPDGHSLVFVVEKELRVASGTSIRHMVETIRIQ